MSNTNDANETRSSRVKIWGAGIILLMIVLMLFPINLGNRVGAGGAGGGTTVIGTARDDVKITAEDRAHAARLLEALDAILVQVPVSAAETGQVPLATACWGEAVVRDFRQHPEALALLLRESARIGPGPNPQALGSFEAEQRSSDAMGLMNSGRISTDDLRPLPGSPIGNLQQEFQRRLGFTLPYVQIVLPQRDARTALTDRVPLVTPSDLPQLEQERVYAAMREFLTVQSAGSLLTSAVKPSRPIVDRVIAERAQVFSLELAMLDAAPRAARVGEPTDAQLAEQLKAFAATPAGSITRENPFGFGYRIPDRVKLEMISFKRSDVRRLVEAERSAYDWEVEARKAFAANPASFTPPTPPPAAGATTQATATPPAAPSFDAVKADAIAQTIDRAAAARAGDIERRIRSSMALDFQQWSTAQVQKTSTPNSTFGVPYESGEYLEKVAADVQAKFKLLPTVSRYNESFRDNATLGLIGAFGRAEFSVPDAVVRKLGVPPTLQGPVYAIQFARDLMAPRVVATAGDAALERYEPSETLVTPDNDGETFIIRLTDTQADHPATVEADLTALKPRLTADWKAQQAQQQVVDEATAAAQAQPADGALNVPGARVTRVDLGPLGNADAVPPAELQLDRNGYFQLGQQVTDKLLADATGQPVAVLSVPLARRVYVARRLAMTAAWRSDEQLAELRQGAAVRAADDLLAAASTATLDGKPSDPAAPMTLPEPLAALWTNVEQIYARNDWKPIAADR